MIRVLLLLAVLLALGTCAFAWLGRHVDDDQPHSWTEER